MKAHTSSISAVFTLALRGNEHSPLGELVASNFDLVKSFSVRWGSFEAFLAELSIIRPQNLAF